MIIKNLLLFLFFILVINLQAYSQTCCSGGVPISNELGLPQGNKNELLIALNYDYNLLDGLFIGDEKLSSQLRSRQSETVISQLSYSLSNKVSVDLLLPYINQSRSLISFDNENEVITRTKGIGDAVLSFKKSFLFDTIHSKTLLANFGIKLPTGSTTERTGEDLFIAADLQPGSGTIDQVSLIRYSQSSKKKPPRAFLINGSYVLTSTNEEYNTIQTYRFGNVFQASTGLIDQYFITNKAIRPSVLVRYRSISKDLLNGGEINNSGGQWLFIDPSIQFDVTPRLSVNAKANFPLYTAVNGEQVSTTSRLNTGVFYNFETKKK